MRTKPKSSRAIIIKFRAIARRTIGKNNKEHINLFSFKDAKHCRGDTSPEQEKFLMLFNQDLSTCLLIVKSNELILGMYRTYKIEIPK